MFIYIHLVQFSSGTDANFIAETKQLRNVFVTARTHAIHPIRAKVAGHLASRNLEPPCQATASCFNMPYQYTFLHGCMYCSKMTFALNLYLDIP